MFYAINKLYCIKAKKKPVLKNVTTKLLRNSKSNQVKSNSDKCQVTIVFVLIDQEVLCFCRGVYSNLL